jgi:hypothetical protein
MAVPCLLLFSSQNLGVCFGMMRLCDVCLNLTKRLGPLTFDTWCEFVFSVLLYYGILQTSQPQTSSRAAALRSELRGCCAGWMVRRKPPHSADLTRKSSTCDPKRGRPLGKCTEMWEPVGGPPSEVLYSARCACDSRAAARVTMQPPRAMICSAVIFSSGPVLVLIAWYRSHFGSRYKLGCCGNASLFSVAMP